jgi:hypothetical protein
MSNGRRVIYSLVAMFCFVVMTAATVYAFTPDSGQASVSKDWLIGILVLLVGFFGGLGVNEIIKRLGRIDGNISHLTTVQSKQSVYIRLIAQHIKLELPDEV